MTYKLPELDIWYQEYFGLGDVSTTEGYTADTLRSEVAAAEKRGAAQREAELMAVGVLELPEPNAGTGWTYTIDAVERIVAAVRLQGAELERRKQVAPVVEQVAKLMQASAVNQQLLMALKAFDDVMTQCSNYPDTTGDHDALVFAAHGARAAIDAAEAHTGEQT